jgi:tetratricopeptide (TPR) repeat protein
VILVLLVWSPSLGNGFAWDDYPLLVDNDALVRPGAVQRAFAQHFFAPEGAGGATYYRPLVTLSYLLERRVHGLEPFPYHLTNVLLHAGAALLLFWLLVSLGLPPWQAWAGAALFGCHPALAESVAWVSGRTDPLAAFFVLLFLAADLRRRHPAARSLALLALAAALLAKESAILAPIIAVLAARTGGEKGSRAVRARLDLAAIAVAYLAVRVAVLGSEIAGDVTAGSRMPWTTRLAAIPHLAGVLLVPAFTRIEYGYGLPPGPLLAGAGAGLVLVAALAAGLRREAAEAQPPVLRFLTVSGLLTLLPAGVAVFTQAVIADRLSYLPAAFLLPAAVVLLARLSSRRVGVAVSAVAIAGCIALSVPRARLWRSERTLFEAAAAEPYPSARVWLNLGIAHRLEGHLAESLEALETSVALAPRKTAHYNLALVHTAIGCDDMAVAHFRAALAEDPGLVPAADSLGRLLAQHGHFDAAIEVLSAGLRHARGDAAGLSATLQLARSQRGTGPREELTECRGEMTQIRQALRDPRSLSALARGAMQARELDRARVLLQAALLIDPGFLDARLDLAQWHLIRRQPAEARAILEEILMRDPDNADARRLLDYARRPRDHGGPAE